MQPYVVMSRLIPTFDFVAAVPMTPIEARANVERALSCAANLLTTACVVRRVACLRARPLPFWHPVPSIAIRFVPSVLGTNLHVRLSVGPLWWTLLSGGALGSFVTTDGLAIAAATAALSIVLLLSFGIDRAMRSVLTSLTASPV